MYDPPSWLEADRQYVRFDGEGHVCQTWYHWSRALYHIWSISAGWHLRDTRTMAARQQTVDRAVSYVSSGARHLVYFLGRSHLHLPSARCWQVGTSPSPASCSSTTKTIRSLVDLSVVWDVRNISSQNHGNCICLPDLSFWIGFKYVSQRRGQTVYRGGNVRLSYLEY